MDDRSSRLFPLLVGVVFLDCLPGEGPLQLAPPPEEFLASCGWRRLSDRDRLTAEEDELCLQEALEREVFPAADLPTDACLALVESGWSRRTADASSCSKANWDMAEKREKWLTLRRSRFFFS